MRRTRTPGGDPSNARGATARMRRYSLETSGLACVSTIAIEMRPSCRSPGSRAGVAGETGHSSAETIAVASPGQQASPAISHRAAMPDVIVAITSRSVRMAAGTRIEQESSRHFAYDPAFVDEQRPYPGTPMWVKVTGIVVAVL